MRQPTFHALVSFMFCEVLTFRCLMVYLICMEVGVSSSGYRALEVNNLVG